MHATVQSFGKLLVKQFLLVFGGIVVELLGIGETSWTIGGTCCGIGGILVKYW